MLVEKLKGNYSDDILNSIDRLVVNSSFSFECLDGTCPDRRLEVLEAALETYNHRNQIRKCCICHHTELLINDWLSDNLCLDCSRIRNNRERVREILSMR